MSRIFICATALALSLGGFAQAQRGGAYTSPPPGYPNAASPVPSSTPDTPSSSAASPDPSQDFKPGMTVKDPSGEEIGKINRVGHTPSGVPAAEVNVDGKPVVMALAALTLTPARDQAISSVTKAQVQAQANQKNP